MWLETNVYMDKDDSQEGETADEMYNKTLRSLGIQTEESIDDISIKRSLIIRIDEIATVMQTKFDNVIEITLVSDRSFYVDTDFDTIKRLVYENGTDNR